MCDVCAIGLCVYFAAFTVVVIGLQAARSIRPEHESNIYKLLVIMVIACAVILVALFSFGARKVAGLIATFGSTEALDRSSVAALQCQLRKQPSFENSQRALRSPTMPLLMPAAAQERLTAAPSGLASHRLAEKVGKFVTSMLNGATRRSEARW